ncbi:MAG: hypothetical protein KDB87_12815 [Flavobacteriales bacterium]|nr:hypothetical protein [Flavobacteriales bacterium]
MTKVLGKWGPPFDVTIQENNHIVGKVYRDGDYFVYKRISDPYYDLNGHATVMRTSQDLNLRLSSESLSPGQGAYGKSPTKVIFDECLVGETAWSSTDPCFTRVRLPLANIMEYLSIWPISEEHSRDGGMVVTAKDFEKFHFNIPPLNAKGFIRFGYHWKSRTFVEQKFTAQAEVAIEYDEALPLGSIKQHEDWLRAFFDYIWFRGHRSGLLYLENRDTLAVLHRRESVSREVKVGHALGQRKILTHDDLPQWIERWFSLDEAQRLAIEPVVTLARNPSIITDMKFVMALHALDALLQTLRQTTSRDKELAARLKNHLGPLWQKKALRDKRIEDYIDHLVWTRNDLLKAVRHEKATAANRLSPIERTSAYFEILLLHRALFLEIIGVEQEVLEQFIETGFKKISIQQFRHFKD